LFKNLIINIFLFHIELKPRLAAKYLPGLPAYILFMCIRYIDFVDDEAHVAGFLSAVTKKIKKLPRVRIHNFI
jgi:myosin-5